MQGYVPARAEYNSGRDSDTKLLEKTIPKYDRHTLTSMIQECGSIMEKAQALGLKSRSARHNAPSRIVPWTIKGAHGEPSYYTMEFTSPVVQYVPPAFASLHLRCRFAQQMDVEYIPCYLMNLNRVVLSKFYMAKSRPNMYDTIGDGLFNGLDFEGGKAMRLSSTNLLLPGSTKERVQGSLQDVIRKCFEYCWWHPPAPNDLRDTSCVHNMIYHTSAQVRGILQVRKTIIRIIRMHRSDMIRIIPDGKAVKCVSADVALLVDNGKNIFSEQRRMFMLESMSYSVKEGTIMNAIIAMQNISHPKVAVIIGHAAEAMQPLDKRPVLGLAMWKILQQVTADSSLTFVADIGVIADRVLCMLENNTAESGVFYPDFMWRFTRNDAERLVSDLFPLYVREGSSVHQMPPAVMSFLAVSSPSVLSKDESVRAILRLFDLVSTDAGRWGERAQSSLEARRNTGATASSWLARLLSSIPPIAVEAALSRVFSEHAMVPPKD